MPAYWKNTFSSGVEFGTVEHWASHGGPGRKAHREHTFTQERRNLPRPAGPSLHSLLSAAAPAPASASGKKAPAERQGRGFRAGPALSAAGRRVRGGGGGGGGRPDVRGGEGPRRWPGSALLRTLKLLLFVFLSFFLFFPRRTCGIWKFPLGGRANKSRSCDLHHSCGRGSLPPAAPGGQPRQPRRTATPGPTAPGPGPALRQSQPGSLPRRRRRTTPATAAFKIYAQEWGCWNIGYLCCCVPRHSITSSQCTDKAGSSVLAHKGTPCC
ncbi:uncharacterized protein LOC110261368 [Sus scrofa]|uniref:uncharacterized protein LOC110261368 n=1 Tax=Sus scrofa TaxID=9823 RepID=UPI000A2B8728|nr:uncharacterized protein LOC110261368 [Sus scrofa]